MKDGLHEPAAGSMNKYDSLRLCDVIFKNKKVETSRNMWCVYKLIATA